jgi:ribonuclease Z
MTMMMMTTKELVSQTSPELFLTCDQELTFQITILGSGSATPTLRSHPSAQVIEIGNEYYLMDCGEGTQYRLLEQHIRLGRLRGIFISHLHGDHYFGLFGLLTSLSLSQRTDPLHLTGPRGLSEVLTEVFRQSDTRLSFTIHFHEVDPLLPGQVFETPRFTVSTLPLQHRVPSTGFLFREKPGHRKLIKEKLTSEIQYEHLKTLKNGEDVYDSSGALLYAYQDYTIPPHKPRSYAYCSDTIYQPQLSTYIKDVDWLYHEATFREEHIERAAKTYHSTAHQAAKIALDARVGKLLIGHLSSRYTDPRPSLEEARALFPNTILAEEGITYTIPQGQLIP